MIFWNFIPPATALENVILMNFWAKYSFALFHQYLPGPDARPRNFMPFVNTKAILFTGLPLTTSILVGALSASSLKNAV